VILLSLSDAIADEKRHRTINIDHRIDIAPTYIETDRISSAVSFPGACPSLHADRVARFTAIRSPKLNIAATGGDRQP
jgi:hypothetical protein